MSPALLALPPLPVYRFLSRLLGSEIASISHILAAPHLSPCHPVQHRCRSPCSETFTASEEFAEAVFVVLTNSAAPSDDLESGLVILVRFAQLLAIHQVQRWQAVRVTGTCVSLSNDPTPAISAFRKPKICATVANEKLPSASRIDGWASAKRRTAKKTGRNFPRKLLPSAPIPGGAAIPPGSNEVGLSCTRPGGSAYAHVGAFENDQKRSVLVRERIRRGQPPGILNSFH